MSNKENEEKLDKSLLTMDDEKITNESIEKMIEEELERKESQ